MKYLKSIFLTLVTIAVAASFAACSSAGNTSGTENNGGAITDGDISDNGSNGKPNGGNTENNGNPGEKPSLSDEDETNILVVYFSCTNTTKNRAEALQAKLDADIYRINPKEIYTSEDLNYSNGSCRANREQNDDKCRPEINGTVDNIRQYDVVYIGYPIWWGQAPKIIYTFLESYDFDGITLIPFCTSGSSAMGSSGTNLHSSAPKAIWRAGCRIGSSSDIDALINMK